jgi:hypothetical protein
MRSKHDMLYRGCPECRGLHPVMTPEQRIHGKDRPIRFPRCQCCGKPVPTVHGWMDWR